MLLHLPLPLLLLPLLPLLSRLSTAPACLPPLPPAPGSPTHLDLVWVLGDQVTQLQPQLVLALALEGAEALVVHNVRQALLGGLGGGGAAAGGGSVLGRCVMEVERKERAKKERERLAQAIQRKEPAA